jgi:son of sevenless
MYFMKKMAKIIGELQRFQVAYNFTEIPEIQSYLEQSLDSLATGGDVTELYRRSVSHTASQI